MTDPNPKDPAKYWGRCSQAKRDQLLCRALQRTGYQLDRESHLATLELPWRWQTRAQQELLLCGMYDGFDCDRCGRYLPDVPDDVNRVVVTPADGVVCTACAVDLNLSAMA